MSDNTQLLPARNRQAAGDRKIKRKRNQMRCVTGTMAYRSSIVIPVQGEKMKGNE